MERTFSLHTRKAQRHNFDGLRSAGDATVAGRPPSGGLLFGARSKPFPLDKIFRFVHSTPRPTSKDFLVSVRRTCFHYAEN